MNHDLFSLRESEIFHTLKGLKNLDFVIIGGYAVNAYALPRFSVDCDIVIKDEQELKRIEKVLLRMGYRKEKKIEKLPYSGDFARYEKILDHNFAVSMNILIQKVTDRMTGSSFSSGWAFEHSKMRILRGKTITEELKVRIIDIDALLAMKIISCRSTDIRDVFMMLPNAQDKGWIRVEVALRYDFMERMSKVIEKVAAQQFKDGLSGVYGNFDQKVFEKHKRAIEEFAEK